MKTICKNYQTSLGQKPSMAAVEGSPLGRRHFAGMLALLASGISALFLRKPKSSLTTASLDEVHHPVWPTKSQASVSLKVRPNPDSVKRHG